MGTRTISTKLAIEGEAQYKQAVASCNSELKMLKSGLALVESEFRNNANSMEALTAKGNALGAVYDKQLEKVADLEAALLNARNAVSAYAEKQADLKSKLEASNQAVGALDEESKKAGERWAEYAEKIKKSESALEALKRKSGDTSSEQEKLEAAIAKARTQMERLDTSTGGAARQTAELIQKNKQLNAEYADNEARLDAAARGVRDWQGKLNSAKIELNGLSDRIEQNNQYLREAEESADGCAHSIDQYGKEVKKAGESSEKFAEGTEKSKVGIEQLAAALAAAGVAKTVKEITDELLACAAAAGSFETAMAKVSTLAGPENLEGMKAQLVELSNETGVAVGSLAEAAYQAMSAGVDAADAVGFVSTATKTSVAGFTDSATAVDVLTTALNAYKLEGDQAERVASMLVKTQDEGKTSVGELAQNMGRVIPVAAAYNVSLENLTTSYALLTKNGTNTSITTTNLSAMFTELSKSGSTVAEVLQKQTGRSFAELMGSGQNLGGILATLSDSVDGDATAFSNLWSSTTAGQAALSLLNSGAEEFNRTLEIMENSSGAVERNFQTMADTTEFAQQRMANAAANLRIAIGDQLNPALENLYAAGADAFTWATDFVEENPWVVGAITGVTVALGALSIGVMALANADAIIGALGKALELLSANPVILAAAAVAGLVAAVGVWASSADDASESTRKFTKSLQESKAAYDDLVASMEEEQASVETLAKSLGDLLGAENKSSTQKELIKRKVDELNEAVPDLALAYDEAADAVINLDTGIKMTAEDIDAMVERAAGLDTYNAKMDRLSELSDEQIEISDRLKEAREQLAEAEEEAANAVEYTGSSYAAAAGTQTDYSAVTAGLRNTINELTAAEEANAAEIAELTAQTNAYSEILGPAAQNVQTAQAAVDGLVADMEALRVKYEESRDAAYSSIESQLGLFNELDGEAKTSIDSLIETLQSQVDYMDTYSANIQRAMEMGVDQGLISKLSDGSEKSAQILAAIVQGGEDDIEALNAALAGVEEGKANFSKTVAQMETDFKSQMEQVTKDYEGALQELDKYEEAYKIAQETAQGLINGAASKQGELAATYRQMAGAALAAYKAAVDQHSPSRKFGTAGSNDIQGVILGAEREREKLAAAYEGLGELATESYADGAHKKPNWVVPGGRDFTAAYEDAAQRMLTASVTHLPSTLEAPSASGALERQLESITAAAVNAIAGTANSGGRPIIITKVMVPDGRVLAEMTFDDLVDYGDSNGTPIVNK